MTYDEFSDKLQTLKVRYLKETGRPLETLAQLELFLERKLISKSKRSTALKSLKGLF